MFPRRPVTATLSNGQQPKQKQRYIHGTISSKSTRPVSNVYTWVLRLVCLMIAITSCTVLYRNKMSSIDYTSIFDTTVLYHNPVQTPKTSRKQFHPNTIAYVVVVTSCGGLKDNTFQIVEGASVLRYSIHENSIHGTKGGTYDYHLYGIYHPSAKPCAEALVELGYTIEARETPVVVSDIRTTELRERIVNNGCCGEKELIKLEALTFTDYPFVVLLDIDVLILQPLDRLFNFMHDPIKNLPHPDDLLYYKKPALSGPNTNVTIPQQIDLLYTTDYAMVHPDRYIKPVQGGFVILRPNQTVYNDLVQIVQTGDFQFDGNTDLGWGGRTGRFWGGTYYVSFKNLYIFRLFVWIYMVGYVGVS